MPALPVIPTQLPSGFCPADYQEMLNAYSAHQFVNVTSQAGGLTVSATKPADQTMPWLQLDQFGRPIRIYWFAQGAWLSMHPLTPGLTQWWFNAVPDFTTFDGGDALAPSTLSGPMWQLAKNSDGVLISAMFPIPAGTLPSTTILTQGATGGEEKHELTEDEMPKHQHFVANPDDSATAVISPSNQMAQSNAAFGEDQYGLRGSDTLAQWGRTSEVGGTPTTNVTAHNNMPPYVVGLLLQRTPRLFYAIL